jgi:hypothetical protein
VTSEDLMNSVADWLECLVVEWRLCEDGAYPAASRSSFFSRKESSSLGAGIVAGIDGLTVREGDMPKPGAGEAASPP